MFANDKSGDLSPAAVACLGGRFLPDGLDDAASSAFGAGATEPGAVDPAGLVVAKPVVAVGAEDGDVVRPRVNDAGGTADCGIRRAQVKAFPAGVGRVWRFAVQCAVRGAVCHYAGHKGPHSEVCRADSRA